MTRLPDGRFEFLAVGVERFRLTSVAADRAPYLVGDGVLLGEPLGDVGQIPALVAAVGRGLARNLAVLAPGEEPSGEADPDGISRRLAGIDDPTALSHLVAGLVLVEPAARQQLLEAATTEAHLAELERVLAREIRLLERRLGSWMGDPRTLAGRNN